MQKTDDLYAAYLSILNAELVPATGCTEPIAIAYAAAKAKEALGGMPQKVDVAASGSIIKNAKSATIPGTGGQRGIKTAVAAGLVAGRADKKLEVISNIPAELQAEIGRYAEATPITVCPTEGKHLFEIVLTVWRGESWVRARIVDAHTNLVSIEKDGAFLLREGEGGSGSQSEQLPYHLLSVADILAFADAAELSDIAPAVQRQHNYNTAIAEEGLAGQYGANIGKLLLSLGRKDDVRTRARAYAAAAADARMSGCDLPVIITAGSGNQGLTTSLPVIVYARHLGSSQEDMFRALALASLITVHQKSAIGKLSAFCGAVSAGVGAGAGVAYLQGGRYAAISHTIVNALAILSGMVCDGAKPSCAAKIAMAVEAGLLGYEMYTQGQQFCKGEGLVAADVEKTIANIGCLGKDGMCETDKEILRMMTCDDM